MHWVIDNKSTTRSRCSVLNNKFSLLTARTRLHVLACSSKWHHPSLSSAAAKTQMLNNNGIPGTCKVLQSWKRSCIPTTSRLICCLLLAFHGLMKSSYQAAGTKYVLRRCKFEVWNDNCLTNSSRCIKNFACNLRTIEPSYHSKLWMFRIVGVYWWEIFLFFSIKIILTHISWSNCQLWPRTKLSESNTISSRRQASKKLL